ncbi:MAG: SprB repeat-containing protein, partial [Flavobacteriales bacterium]
MNQIRYPTLTDHTLQPYISKYAYIILAFIGLCLSSTSLLAQVTSPNVDYVQPTQYTNGMPNDEIFVFCSPDVNGNAITGSLTATPTIAGPGFTFDWGMYDDVTHTYTSILVENGSTSTINNLASGGYNVTITNNNGDVEVIRTWVYVSTVNVDISLDLDPINPGCEPFDVNGTIDATGFTYWDPLEPGTEPFIIDQNTTIEVCFSANHTWVSDLGFVLIGPPSCGSPEVTLYPNPQVANSGAVCCCNSNDNINNLCFSSASSTFYNVCGQPGPLTGTYEFYDGGFPYGNAPGYPTGGIPGLYGCNAAEGGWAVQIYDCINLDSGSLTGASITFSNGTSTIVYDSGAINSTINDNSCDAGTASIYVVPLTTPIDPDPQVVPNSGTLTYQLGLNGSPVTLAPGTNNFTQSVDPIPTYDEWYYLFIQDELGCSAIDSSMFDFTGYADATIDDINATNFLCLANAPVQMTAATTGGVWSGAGVDAAGLFDPALAGVGTHTITYTIADPCGDVATKDITVGDLTVQITNQSDALCFGSCDGTATAEAIGGTAPYQYQWDDPSLQQTDLAIDLCANTYTVVAEDAVGCIGTAQVVIAEPTAIVPNAIMDAQSNCNLPDGEASASAIGGTIAVDYSFVWDSNPVQNTAVATGLLPNTYTVTVTDD